MNIKKLLLITASIASMSLMAGCGTGGGGDSESLAPKDPSSITGALKVWCPTSASYKAVFDDAVSRFTATYPNVTISIEQKSVDSIDALRTALNDSKSRPDVAICDHVYVQTLAADGLLANLTSYDQAFYSGATKALFPQGIYDATVYKDSAYAMPLSANTIILWANKNILQEAGVTAMPTTYDEFVTALSAVKTNAPDKKAFTMPVNSPTFSPLVLASYIARNGGKMVSDDYKTVTLSSDACLNAFHQWYGLKPYVANPKSFDESSFYDFKTMAFIEMGSWNISKVQTDADFVDYAEMITLKEGVSNVSGLGLYATVIPQASSNKDAAYVFSRFLATDKTFQMAYGNVEKLFPVTKEALADEAYTSDPILSKYASQLTKVVARPGVPYWEVMASNLDSLLYTIMNDCNSVAEVDEAVKATEKSIQKVANQYYL